MEYFILYYKVPLFLSALQNSYYFRPTESLLLPSVLHYPCYFLLSCRVSIICFFPVESLLLPLFFSVFCLLVSYRSPVASVRQSTYYFRPVDFLLLPSVVHNPCYFCPAMSVFLAECLMLFLGSCDRALLWLCGAGTRAVCTVHSAHSSRPRTPYAAVHNLVLLIMGIMMSETCWDKSLIINIRLVASCWFLSLRPMLIACLCPADSLLFQRVLSHIFTNLQIQPLLSVT
jgi:hypothetical protein